MQKLVLFIIISLLGGVALPGYADYRTAQGYFSRHDYVSSASAFFQSYSAPRDAAEKAKSEWGLAQSLQRLGFLYSASKYYSIIVRRGNSGSNPFFRKALEELGVINSTVSLGQSHVVQLFRGKIDPDAVPGPARGFYFYYLGIEAFNSRKYEVAGPYFRRVPSGSPYYLRALFHQGVIANLTGQHSRAITFFDQVISGSANDDHGDYLHEQANLNIARVYYETQRFQEALSYYAQIQRDSENWLEALFESSWAFFMIQKHNNVLGTIHTIHSPFFDDRFFPETYILQAITFLRLCRYKEVKLSLQSFKARYKPVYDELRQLLRSYDNDSKGFFRIVYDYKVGTLNKYHSVRSILDALSHTDSYKEANDTIRFSDKELARLSQLQGRWDSTGLLGDLRDFLAGKKAIAVADAGHRLLDKASSFWSYLKELSDQTSLIQAEMLLGKIDELRRQLNVGAADRKVNFIGGLQPLVLGQDLEYWPFEGEYWEDELGGYVYNIDSKCSVPKKK